VSRKGSSEGSKRKGEGWLVDWCLTAQTKNYIVPQEYEIYYEWPGHKKNTIKQGTVH